MRWLTSIFNGGGEYTQVQGKSAAPTSTTPATKTNGQEKPVSDVDDAKQRITATRPSGYGTCG